MNTDTYKLYYFPVNGRGGAIRALLRYLKISYENITISEEWPKMKESGKFEYLQMPGLEINGTMYTQSLAIERYLARKHDLMGKTPEIEYEINNILESTEDLWSALNKFGYPLNDEMKKNGETYKQEFIDKVIKYLKVYQRKYEKYGKKKYLLGDEITLADIHLKLNLLAFSAYLQGMEPWKQQAPEICALLDKNADVDLKDFFDNDYINPKAR